jgi:hypothetical protein
MATKTSPDSWQNWLRIGHFATGCLLATTGRATFGEVAAGGLFRNPKATDCIAGTVFANCGSGFRGKLGVRRERGLASGSKLTQDGRRSSLRRCNMQRSLVRGLLFLLAAACTLVVVPEAEGQFGIRRRIDRRRDRRGDFSYNVGTGSTYGAGRV